MRFLDLAGLLGDAQPSSVLYEGYRVIRRLLRDMVITGCWVTAIGFYEAEVWVPKGDNMLQVD